MYSVDGQHIGIDIGALDRLVPEWLADVFQRPPVQEQVYREGMPEGMAADPKQRPAHLLHNGINVPVLRLASHRKDTSAFFEVPRIEVVLDPVLQQAVDDRHGAPGER